MSVTLLAVFFSSPSFLQQILSKTCIYVLKVRQTEAHTHIGTRSILWGISHIHSLCLFLFVFFSFFSAVRFQDCGRAGRVHFECSQPTDFRIEITGEVLSLWTIRPALSSSSLFISSPLLVIARDDSTQEQWQTEIWLRPSTGHESQVFYLNVSICFTVRALSISANYLLRSNLCHRVLHLCFSLACNLSLW